MNRAIGWDHPATARYYRRFVRRFQRYGIANEILADRAKVAPGMRVLDLGAGSGGTAQAALTRLGPADRIVCVEPAAAMREMGRKVVRDGRVAWTPVWPRKARSFDRILCGAALWQMRPLEKVLRRCHALLRPGGCLTFNIPALYLGEPDLPGGGRDPHLTELSARVAHGRVNRARPRQEPRLTADRLDALLSDAGFTPARWSFSIPMTQAAYREWLKIPPTTDGTLIGLSPRRRAAVIDRAYRGVDADSWKEERWTGWTAWKN